LKSPTAKDCFEGLEPRSMLVGVPKVPVPLPLASSLPSNTLTVPSALAVARSSVPSALKSPTASESGAPPVAEVRAGWKVPLVLPSSTLTVLLPELTTARS